MRKFIIIGLILFCASQLPAQSLSVFNLDATNFPTIKAKFYAFDANRVQQSPSASEITVTEDGVPRIVTSVTCPPKKDPPAITLGIMVDTYSGIDLAKYGAQKLINLLSIPPSEAGITMMDHGAFIVQDLTQRTAKLTTAIAKLQPAPGVDLQTMFYAPNAGGVPFVSGRQNKKVLVLITDLHCPLLNLDKAQFFADCAKEKITTYIVLLGTNDMGYAKEISDKTGGLIFEDIESNAGLDNAILNIYYSINAISDFSPCVITWQSDVSCTPDRRSAGFNWNKSSSNLSYTVPAFSLAELQFAPNSLSIYSKVIGQKFDTLVTVTAVNSAFSVTNITSSNLAFDINPKAFILAKGESKTLTVSFTPSDSNYTWTRFDISSDRCAQIYYSIGSYPGYKPTKPTLELMKPNGGEIFTVGTDTLITWAGIPLIDTVKLEYSFDNGRSWNLINYDAVGGKSLWNVPKPVSNKCLVRVIQSTAVRKDSWVDSVTGKNNDSSFGTGIAVDASGNIYIVGYFSGIVNIGGISLISRGNTDVFLAKCLPDGNVVWAKQAGGVSSDAGSAIAIDALGSIYITGYFDGTTNFDGFLLTSAGKEDVFIAKYLSDGTLKWARQMGGHGTDVGYSIAPDRIGNLYITGYGENGINGTPSVGNDSIFLAKYLSDGTLEWIKEIGYKADNSGFSVTCDSSGSVYVTGKFSGVVDFGGITLTSVGMHDVFIVKYDRNGNIVWAKQAGSPSRYSDGTCIVVDFSESIYVTGYFADTITFGNTVVSSPNYNTGSIFLAKYDNNGSLIWAEQAGANNLLNNYIANKLTVDPSGNIYVIGSFNGTANFNNLALNSINNTEDVFIAKYRPDGSVEWVKRAGGYGSDFGNDIALDSSSNIYTTGFFDGTWRPDFDGLKINTNGDHDAFIWKIGSDILQGDTSDAVFSIVMPTFSFASNYINMGIVEVGTEKDSIVKATICNSGSGPLHIIGMDITGGDKAEFMIMSGAGNFTLQPGQCRDVMFTYMPMMTGKMFATVTVRTTLGDYPDTIKILGEGIAPLLSVMTNVIDFGQVKIGSFKDTTISVAIQNIGNFPVNFSTTSQLGPDVKQFSLQSGGAPFTLYSGAKQSVTLRFAPHFIGRTSGRIGFDYNGPSSPAILNVFGQGLGGLVAINNDSGYAGDHKNIPMILEKVPITSVQSAATNFSARIAYDRTVLYPSSGTVQHGARFDTVTVNGALGASETLALLPFTALLGESTTSPMNIVDFSWLDGSGQPADFDAETLSGTFYMLGICPAGGTRLYNPDGQVSMAHINPNPANGIIHIEIQTTEVGRTQLSLMNLLGEKVATISDGELKPGLHTFDFNSHSLTSGSYFLLLQTPTVRRMERVDLQK